uniref:NAD(+) ADP-ribosyltransferase n=1 Tax=Parastrongyloides trichosuri TaxID=131310 RepID=A0A0N5A3T8_PARTI
MPVIPRIVRFSSQKPIEHEIPESIVETVETPSINAILSIPLPRRLSDSEFNIEIHTASSTEKEATEYLLKNKANPNATNQTKWTPLMYAAYLGHTSICELLLKKGAGLNNQNQKGQTALMLAATCGHDLTVKILIKEGADTNKQDCSGQTALHYAVTSSQVGTVEYLLAYGANPNLADIHGMTATLESCSIGHEKILSLLLKNKGNPLLLNKKGENGVNLVGDSPTLLSVLRKHGTIIAEKKKLGITNITINATNKNSEIESSKSAQKITYTIPEMLKALKLEKYASNFEINKIDMTNFFTLNDEELEEMGIKAFGPKKKLLNIIQRYQQTGIFDLIQDNPEGTEGSGQTVEEMININNQMTTKLNDCQRRLYICEEETKQQKKIIEKQQNIINKLSTTNEMIVDKIKELSTDISMNQFGIYDANQLAKLQERIMNCIKDFYSNNN